MCFSLTKEKFGGLIIIKLYKFLTAIIRILEEEEILKITKIDIEERITFLLCKRLYS